jgi:hypothetical protein
MQTRTDTQFCMTAGRKHGRTFRKKHLRFYVEWYGTNLLLLCMQ